MSGNDDARTDTKRLIADAVEDARDAPLEPARLESIRQLLLTSPEARRYYLQVNEINHHFAGRSVLPPESEIVALQSNVPAAPLRSRFFTTRVLTGAVTVLAVVVSAAVLLRHREPPVTRSYRIAQLEQINGEVFVTTAGADARTISASTDIASGDTIRTHGAPSSALLRHADGTRLLLAGNSSLTVSDFGQKSVVFHAGTMFATVAPQPAGRPMLITTPKDTLQIVGTRFSLDATEHRTDLCVSEGRVKITRLRDGESVEVPAGQRVVSDSASELALEKIPAAPDTWNVDFESGLPDGWESGALVADDLPNGSRLAVKAVRVDEGADESYAIVSQPNWLRGVFSVHPDSSMQITFKMETPSWINVFIITHTRDSAEPHFANNFQYNEIPFGRLQPGRWYSITIPLAEFKRLPGYTDEPLQDLLPFQIVFNFPAPDRGLVIDEIRIARGGPETVELKRID